MKTIRSLMAVAAIGAFALSGAAVANTQLTITHYDITDASVSGSGGWGHTYDGTITPAGTGNFNGGIYDLADYTGGSGTLNDGVHGTGAGDTQLFGQNATIRPVITLYLGGFYTINDLTLQSFVGGNIIPGSFAGIDVTIGGFTESFTTTEPVDNDEFVDITGSSLEGVSTDRVILDNFVHDGNNGGVLDELFSISEVVINGKEIPAPGALALLGLAGLAGARRRRA